MSRTPLITDHLEQELTAEPIKGSAVGSIVLHAGLLASFLVYGVLTGLFHGNTWGGSGLGGAMQVSMTTALPLPSTHPPNENVLSTETPSEAPTAPAPMTKQAEDDTAIPISGKQKPKERETQQRSIVKPQQPVQTNRADYGEQAGSSMPRATQGSGGPASVNDAGFGSMFGWYVQGINRKMSANWLRSLVDTHTPRGARAYIDFTIYRDGSAGNVRLERSSGSSTLDSSCMRAAQRVDTFGALPSQYRSSSLQVAFYCEY